MPPRINGSRATALSERACIAILCLWLFWLPLPFGSNVPGARLPLIAIPFFCVATAAAIRLRTTRERSVTLHTTQPFRFWCFGALSFLVLGLLQLLPLPAALHRLLEPESYDMWEAASAIGQLADAAPLLAYPLTLDPDATARELWRMGGLLAAFLASTILVRTHARRMAVAVTLSLAAVFEAFYGVREAALGRYSVWGWPNTLIQGRVTGTFVNPNHFAHYLAIALPIILFVFAVSWREGGRDPMPLHRRLARMVELRPWSTGFAVLSALACGLGIMLAQSRGALLALGTALVTMAAILPGRRIVRSVYAGLAGLLLVAAFVLLLTPERTVGRFQPSELERQTFVGRTTGIGTAMRLWQRFPLFGTGWGTFSEVVSMEQREDLTKIYNRAHNDYMEIAATAGTLGAVVAMVTLLSGFGALMRMTFGRAGRALSWRRRAWQAAALTSLMVAMVHALYDFNLFIPSNPATLAVILGAAVASIDHDKVTRL